ncbi:hypothetical protein [Vibrio tritonius]|uniref:hypothetical protein n=1 Tax=Vibrio tritonius TaxID=1435069 RepID=UPI000838C77A|nr:hypothetical protein [Vibrio tritonius]
MKFVFPIQTSNGKEFANAKEFEKILKQETIGQYGFNPSHSTFHGGVHFTKKNAPWVRNQYPIRAIADGKIVACRLNYDYPETTYDGRTLPFSNDFCLIEHKFDYKDESDQNKTFIFYSLYMHLAALGDKKSEVEEEPVQHVLAQSWFGRVQPKIENADNTFIKLKKGTVLILDEETEPREFDNGSQTLTFRKYTVKDNCGLVKSLSMVGTNLWLADDPTPSEQNPQFIVKGGPVENAPEPTWFYQKLTAEVIADDYINVRSDPSTNGEAGEIIGRAMTGCTLTLERKRALKFYTINGQKYLMAKCEFKNDKAFKNDAANSPITLGWIAITNDNIKITGKTDALDFNNDANPVTETSISIRAGEPIGYLGRFDVLENDSEKGYAVTTRYQLHHELMSLEKPPQAFLKAYYGDEKAESLQFASDNESHGYLLENGLSDFFRNLALCAKRSEVPCEEREGITVEDEQVLSVLTPEAASQLTVVQHTSEWYHKSDTSFLFKELDRIFGVNDRLQHEKDRADQLAWMQNTSIFSDSSAVWNWWPVFYSKNCIPLIKAKEIALKVSAGFEGKEPSYRTLAGNFDGAGMSWGIIQYNFGQNTLGPLLRKMKLKDLEQFNGCFDKEEDLASLNKVLNSSITEQINWAIDMQNNKRERWVKIFNNLSEVELFNRLQLEGIEKYSDSAISAIEWMRDQLPKLFERVELVTFVALFDLSVQQGSINKSKQVIMERISEREPKTQKEFLEIVVSERGKSASTRWRADCLSRRLSILNKKVTKIIESGYTSMHENKNLGLIVEGNICDF